MSAPLLIEAATESWPTKRCTTDWLQLRFRQLVSATLGGRYDPNWKWDLEKLSGGNISENFIRPYSLYKTPNFNSFPKLKAPNHSAEEKQEYYTMKGAILERISKHRERDRKLIRLKIAQ